MPRTKRAWIAEELGAYHLISRVAGGDLLFGDEEKEYLLKLIERYAAGFYVDIHAFCVMGNHFHILATGSESRAAHASEEELVSRYRAVYGSDRAIPEGSYQRSGEVDYDDDGGIERLRARLGSISRFMQELKQSFSRWYNKKHRRRGYLWGDRFKGVLVAKGESMLACSAYIDLNPVRAGLVEDPEEYRFSSMGLKVRKPKLYKKMVKIFELPEVSSKQFAHFYRQFVFESGAIPQANKATVPRAIVEKVQSTKGRLGLGQKLRYRFVNFSEGVAIGTQSFIADLQREMGRKFIRPRLITEKQIDGDSADGRGVFSTRMLSAV